jgi:hypothetical protein
MKATNRQALDHIVTPEMIEAGEDAVASTIGDLGGYFSASELAEKVYRAMAAADLSKQRRSHAHNPTE